MRRIRTVCLLCLTVLLPTAALAQSELNAAAPKWVSDQATDPTGTRTCSVYPLREGAYPVPQLAEVGRGNRGDPLGPA